MDLLVNLYGNRMHALKARAEKVDATIRVALPPEQHIIKDWVRTHFSEYWVSEVTAAMAHQPPGCLIATVDDQLVGFACYDATARGFFGPTGVCEDQRGKGLGVALFYHTLAAMKAHGYAYAIVGSAGPVDFYVNAADAMPIASEKQDIYQGLLRIEQKPQGTQ
ncbi:GNAT family N-acetyltransferase [Pelagibacterium sp.]|uniref:GNAT family N-acetyltransferase n=1 Tax=Pelagibacterium sp. TaxID=1967288 RepID=UPI003A8D783D